MIERNQTYVGSVVWILNPDLDRLALFAKKQPFDDEQPIIVQAKITSRSFDNARVVPVDGDTSNWGKSEASHKRPYPVSYHKMWATKEEAIAHRISDTEHRINMFQQDLDLAVAELAALQGKPAKQDICVICRQAIPCEHILVTGASISPENRYASPETPWCAGFVPVVEQKAAEILDGPKNRTVVDVQHWLYAKSHDDELWFGPFDTRDEAVVDAHRNEFSRIVICEGRKTKASDFVDASGTLERTEDNAHDMLVVEGDLFGIKPERALEAEAALSAWADKYIDVVGDPGWWATHDCEHVINIAEDGSWSVDNDHERQVEPDEPEEDEQEEG
jgi:hypothetical protein